MSRKVSKVLKKPENIQKEDVIQAIIISDNFNPWFDPITFTKPTSLIPLVNTVLIDYTLEFLALSGVHETIIFCSSHSDLIKEHVSQCKWSAPVSPMMVTVIVSEGCRSFGDAMRDLDAKAVIKGDFILLNGDTVANIQLLPILEQHRKFVSRDKGAVMTLLYKEAGPGHRSRSPEDETLLAVDSATSRVLYHHKLGPGTKKVIFPVETFTEQAQVDLLYNLQDTHISICTPAVPPLFSDNFDFQTRDHFVRGLLLNEEILASTIYWHRLEAAEYAARVTNWHMYQAISHDVIHRWVYPLVPDSSHSRITEPYMYLRHNVYKQKTVKLAKGCVLEEDVVMAEGTTVGENTYITHSVIGKDCHIGNNVRVTNSYIWDGVLIEDDCCVDWSVVADGAVLRAGCILNGGCILAPGVQLEKATEQQAALLVASPIITKDDFGDEQKLEMQKLGDKAFLYQLQVHDSDSEDEGKVYPPPGLVIGSDEEISEDESEDMSGSSDMSYRASPVPDDTHMFFNEVLDSLARGYEDKLHCDNLILEINSSRYAYNVSVQEVNFHMVRALLSMTVPNSAQYFVELRKRITYFLPILKNYVRNDEAQQDCLNAIENIASSKSELLDSQSRLLHFLYDSDILDEDAILKWYNNPDEASPSAEDVRKQVKPFIQWLEEADAETDSESGSN